MDICLSRAEQQQKNVNVCHLMRDKAHGGYEGRGALRALPP